MVNTAKIVYNDGVFQNNTNIVYVDMNNAYMRYNKMVNTFYNCKNLTTVTNIPTSVVEMNNTFYNCSNKLIIPTIPNSVIDLTNTFDSCEHTSINIETNSVKNMTGTFNNCQYLQSINIVSNSVEVMDSTFNGCYNLTSMPNIPESVTTLYHTFGYCYNLTHIQNIPDSVTNMTGTFRICSKLVNAPSLPNNVQDISYIFSDCYSLNNITAIPNSVTNMAWTFAHCRNLVNVPTIPNSVTNMYMTFQNCYNLKNVPSLPSNTKYLQYTFLNCNNITTLPNIPYGVYTLTYTYSGCSNVQQFPEIPNSVSQLFGTYKNCHKLTSENVPTMPNSVTDIQFVFSHCNGLVSTVEVPNSIVNMYSSYEYCSNLTNAYYIPNNTLDISRIFCECVNLTTVGNIPPSIIKMWYSFYGCSKLTGNINIYSTQVQNALSCFQNTSLTKNVYIPFYYDNGSHTITYNSFTTAGYDENGTQHGVYLKDIVNHTTLTYTMNPTNSTLYIEGKKITDNPCQIIGLGTRNYTVYNDDYTPLFGTIDNETIGQELSMSFDLTNNIGVQLTIEMSDGLDATIEMSYGDYKTNSNHVTVVPGTEVTYVVSRTGFATVKDTVVVTENHTISVTMIEATDEEVNLSYPFDTSYTTFTLDNLIDGNNFIISDAYQAIVSGPSSHNVGNGTSYGYIKFTTPGEETTVSVTGYASSESSYDLGAVYIGTQPYQPSQYQIQNWETDGYGDYLMANSGEYEAQTYTKTLEPNTTYYLSFAYAKDSSVDTQDDRLIITNIQFKSAA